jgi:hypothetical protein
MTNNSENFVDKKSALALSNVEFYSLDQADKYDLSTGNYYVSETRCDEVAAGLQEYGYGVTIAQQAKVSGKTPAALFAAIPVILLLMSIIFYILSVGKRTVLRKMEGYTDAAILKEGNYSEPLYPKTISGFPFKASRIAVKALIPCLCAVPI